MPETGFRVEGRRPGFRGSLVRVDVLKIKTASGRRYTRELIRHPGAVVIIPRLKKKRLLLIRQLRVAVGGWIWEFPAGTLERGESPLACARRELREETQHSPGRLRKVLEFFPTPGISTEVMHLFVAEDLKPGAPQGLDPDEELVVRDFSVSQVDEMIRNGRILDGKTILGFLFFQKYIA